MISARIGIISMNYYITLFLLAASAFGETLIESSSFGQNNRISPNGYGIPGWHVSGVEQVPQMSSNKVILTPPDPGNVRGALWSESTVVQSEWTVELDFRASGPERGGGNLQIWHTKNGKDTVGTSSLYTVGNFEGMVLVLDQYGGKGGSIRGFLNDGGLDFRNHHAIDSLAFGHCDYAFRNLGRPSKMLVRQSATLFEVIIDSKICFSSDKIRIPSGYGFGLTAGSAETPDSFEVFKFQVFTPQEATREEPHRETPQQIQHQPDVQASSYQSSEAQFEDLHNRLQTIAHAVEKLDAELGTLRGDSYIRHQEISRGLMTRETINTIASQSDKLDRIEKTVNAFQGQISSLHGAFKDSHLSLTESLPKHVGSSKWPTISLLEECISWTITNKRSSNDYQRTTNGTIGLHLCPDSGILIRCIHIV